MNHPPAHHAAVQHRGPDGDAMTPAEVWRMVVPGLGYVFLAGAAVLGLFTASAGSAAGDQASYVAGLGCFVVAVFIMALRLRRQFDGEEVGFLLYISVANVDSLLVSIVVLTVLGLIGVVLASAVGGAFSGIGLALFVIAALMIFTDLKRFFDHREGKY